MCGPPGIGDVSHTNDKVMVGEYGLGKMEEVDDVHNILPYKVGPLSRPLGQRRKFLGGELLPISGQSHFSFLLEKNSI